MTASANVEGTKQRDDEILLRCGHASNNALPSSCLLHLCLNQGVPFSKFKFQISLPAGVAERAYSMYDV